MPITCGTLTQLLAAIRDCDPSHFNADGDYGTRNRLIYAAIAEALSLGYRAGVTIDPEDPAWPVAYIDLPAGQVSWHLPAYPGEWDGHDTEAKYRRVDDHITGRYAPST